VHRAWCFSEGLGPVGTMGRITHFQALVQRDLRHGAQGHAQDVYLVQLAALDVKAEQSEMQSMNVRPG
jgi:hypothetical protein